jgi:hypothetical protein
LHQLQTSSGATSLPTLKRIIHRLSPRRAHIQFRTSHPSSLRPEI